jgi:hypothetical protein
VSVNLSFLTSYHNNAEHFEKISNVAKDGKFIFGLKYIRSGNRDRVPSNRIRLEFRLTKAKYTISRLSMLEKENYVII